MRKEQKFTVKESPNMKKSKKKSPLIPDILVALTLAIATLGEFFILNATRGGFDFETYFGYVACMVTFASIPIGALVSVLICVITRKSDRGRDHSYVFFVIRLLALLVISATLCYLKGNETPEAFPDGELAGSIVGLIIGLALVLAGQMYVSAKILDNMLIPPYEGSPAPKKNPEASTEASSSSSSSSSTYSSSTYPSDSVKETDFYKEKYSEYYDMYMGRPHEEKKIDTEFLEDHDYSHIFEDNNF